VSVSLHGLKLQDKVSDKEYFALNTHLDHVGGMARREGISLMLDKVNELSDGLPVIVTGDFNSEPESDVIKHVTDSANPEHLTDARQAVSQYIFHCYHYFN